MASLNIATAISFEGFSNERHHRPQLQQHLQQHVCQQAASRTLAVLLAKHQGPLHSPPPPSPPSATPLFAYDHHHLSNENQPTVRTSGSGLQGNPWGRATGRQSLEKLKRFFFINSVHGHSGSHHVTRRFTVYLYFGCPEATVFTNVQVQLDTIRKKTRCG